jgi:hypothetical protein
MVWHAIKVQYVRPEITLSKMRTDTPHCCPSITFEPL